MPNIAAATNYITRSYENTVPMTITSTVLAGAATVNVTGLTNYNDGDVVVLVVDPATPALKQAFTGTKVGAAITNVVWTEFPTGGVNVQHAAGATVVDYVTATHWDLLRAGLLTGFNPNGNGLLTSAVQTALNITGGAAGGWTPSGFAPSAVVYNGNRNYTLTFASDLTAIISPGNRLQFTRTVAAPSQATALNGTSQAWSKATPTGISFVGDHSYHFKAKFTAYQQEYLVSRLTGGLTGFAILVQANGQLQIQYGNGASLTQIATVPAVPVNREVTIDVAVSVAAKTAVVLFDGIAVATTLVAGTATTVVQPAAATTIAIGSDNTPANFAAATISQVALFSSALSTATMQSFNGQTLVGNESTCIGFWAFNGNANDANANANNLTAVGGAAATATTPSFAQGVAAGLLEYGICHTISFSVTTTMNVQLPEGSTLPTTGGISGVSYSNGKVPYRFPSQRGRWQIRMLHPAQFSTSSTTYVSSGQSFSVPIGEWIVGYQIDLTANSGGASGNHNVKAALSTGTTTADDLELVSYVQWYTTGLSGGTVSRQNAKSLTVATTYNILALSDAIQAIVGVGSNVLYAENGWL